VKIARDTPRPSPTTRLLDEQAGYPYPQPLTFEVSEAAIERIAVRAAEILDARWTKGTGRGPDPRFAPAGVAAGPYLTVREAADYLRAKPQRVYDLLSSRRLTRFKDGRRVLVSRTELDAYLSPNGSSRVAPLLPPAAQRRSASGLVA